MEVYKILCRYYILHIASFGSLPCFLLSSFCATWRRNRMPLYHLNFEGEGRGGVGGMGDLVCARIFFPQTSGDIIFSWHATVLHFFQRYTPWKVFFSSAGTFFAGHFLTRNFFPSKSVCIIFFSEITHTSSPLQKSNGRPITENELPEHGFENNVFFNLQKVNNNS